MRDLHDRVRDVAAARSRIREHSIRRTAESPLPEAFPGTLLGGFVAAFAGAVLVGWPTDTPWARLLGIALALAAVWAFTRAGGHFAKPDATIIPHRAPGPRSRPRSLGKPRERPRPFGPSYPVSSFVPRSSARPGLTL